MALPVKKNKLVHVLLKFCISKDKASCLNQKLAKSDVYYNRHDHLKMKYFTVLRISNFVVLCLFFVPIDKKQVKINILPFLGQ